MAKRRPSPTEDDIRRIAETIRNTDTFKKIKDRQTLLEAYQEYMTEDNDLYDREDIQKKVFKEYAYQYNTKILEEIAPQQPRKRVAGIRRELTVLGVKQEPVKIGRKNFDIPAKERGRIVYSYKTKVIVRGKEQIRYRDRFGRFAGVKKDIQVTKFKTKMGHFISVRAK